ncbi:MAG: SRPBCC family protein [Paludibacter sp.]|nr:SRPBCC family protein [Paludibacter sp.]
MTTYESDIKTISSSEEVVFGILSDLNNLKRIQDNPELANKVKDIEFDADSVSFSVEGFGKIGLKVIEREPFKTIKFASEHAPVEINVWIQLKQVAENDTRMKLTLKAKLPAMIKMMVDKKLKEGINKVADLIVKALTPNP